MRLLLRLAGLLRVEELLLALLATVGLPLLERWLRDGVAASSPAGEPTALIGTLGLLGVGGVIACVLTRGPDESPPLDDRTLTLQGWVRFPLATGVGIVALGTIPGLGIDPEPLVGLTFLAVFAGTLLHPRLPVIQVTARRVLVLPMVVLAAGAFDRIIGRDLGPLALGIVGGTQPDMAAFWPLVLGAVAVLYAMLVVAPRAIADPGSSGLAWTVRFGFLLLAVVIAAILGIR